MASGTAMHSVLASSSVKLVRGRTGGCSTLKAESKPSCTYVHRASCSRRAFTDMFSWFPFAELFTWPKRPVDFTTVNFFQTLIFCDVKPDR